MARYCPISLWAEHWCPLFLHANSGLLYVCDLGPFCKIKNYLKALCPPALSFIKMGCSGLYSWVFWIGYTSELNCRVMGGVFLIHMPSFGYFLIYVLILVLLVAFSAIYPAITLMIKIMRYRSPISLT